MIEETLKQAISFPKMMLQLIQVAIPCLNVHSEGGASDGENHTNAGGYLLFYPLSLYLIFSFFIISS